MRIESRRLSTWSVRVRRAVFIARVSTLRSGRSVLVTPPPHRAPFTCALCGGTVDGAPVMLIDDVSLHSGGILSLPARASLLLSTA